MDESFGWLIDRAVDADNTSDHLAFLCSQIGAPRLACAMRLLNMDARANDRASVAGGNEQVNEQLCVSYWMPPATQ